MRKFRPFRALGAGLLALGLATFGYFAWLDWQANAAASRALTVMSELPSGPPVTETAAPVESPAPTPTETPYAAQEMPTIEVDGQTYIGALSIPSLSLELPVLSNWSNEKLEIAPCRYAGDVYNNGFVIAGHNYRSIFSPLHRVSEGAEVIFFETDGTEHRYTVALKETLQPGEVDEMKSEQWALSLFTCTTGGRARLTIRCQPADEV